MSPEVLAFFEKAPGALALYQVLEARLREAVPDMTVKAGKSQLSFYLGHQFGCASLLRPRPKGELPDPWLTVTIGLAYPLESPRVAARTQPYPGRWTHHIVLGREEDVDGELLSWLKEAAAFAASKRGKPAKP